MKNWKYEWNEWLLDVVHPIRQAVTRMNEISPENGNNKTTYEEIATKWFTEMPLHAYELDHFDSSEGYQLRLKKLRDIFTYRYNRTQYWHKWFETNYPIWTVLPGQKGSNLKGNTRAMIHPDKDLLTTILEPQQVADAFVKEYPSNCELDWIDINLPALKKYTEKAKADIQSADNSKGQSWHKKMQRNITDSILIAKFAEGCNEVIICTQTGGYRHRIPQPYRISPFGRKYYLTSYALQNKSSNVRSAALGRCWSVDIDSSVFRFYKMLAHGYGIETPELDLLLKDKHAFREELATTIQNLQYNKTGLIKKCITSMGFGARDTSYYDYKAEKQKGALQAIIKNKEDRDRLTEHPLWVGLKVTYKQIKARVVKDEYSLELKRDPQYWVKNAYTQDRLMSLLYQQYESGVIERTWELLDKAGRAPELLVHDGLYTLLNPNRDNAFNDGILPVLQSELNPYLKFDIEENGLWIQKQNVEKLDQQDQEHKSRMAQQQRIAEQSYGRGTNGQEWLTQRRFAQMFNGNELL